MSQQQEDCEKTARELTAEEEQAFKDAFDTFDKNGNGEISRLELAEVWRAVGGNPTDADVDEALRSMDKNNDDVVTFDEFHRFIQRNPPEEAAAQLVDLAAAFARFDRDKDGSVRLDDLRAVLGRGDNPMSSEEIEALFKEIDSSEDGKVNIEEMTAFLIGTRD